MRLVIFRIKWVWTWQQLPDVKLSSGGETCKWDFILFLFDNAFMCGKWRRWMVIGVKSGRLWLIATAGRLIPNVFTKNLPKVKLRDIRFELHAHRNTTRDLHFIWSWARLDAAQSILQFSKITQTALNGNIFLRHFRFSFCHKPNQHPDSKRHHHESYASSVRLGAYQFCLHNE